jgi:hypothetical protein
VIYEAGDVRTSFVAFWKAAALIQFGVVAVFFAPMMLHYGNQPDETIRFLQTVGGKSISTLIPS